MTNMAKVMSEALVGIVLVVVAVVFLADPSIVGQFSGINALIIQYLPTFILLVYLLGILKTGGLLGKK